MTSILQTTVGADRGTSHSRIFEHLTLPRIPVSDLEALLDSAILFWDEQDRSALIERWEATPEDIRDHSLASLISALIKHKARQYDDVIELLSESRVSANGAYTAYATVILVRALGMRQRYRESIAILQDQLQSVHASLLNVRLSLLHRLGVSLMFEGEYKPAMNVLTEAHSLSTQLGLQFIAPQIYNDMATVTLRMGDSVKAIGMYETALLALIHEPAYEAVCDRMRINLASVLQHIGRMQDALDIYKALLSRPVIAGNDYLVMPIRINMAIAYKSLDKYAESASCYEVALSVARTHDHSEFQRRALMGIAHLHVQSERYDDALASVNEAIALSNDSERTPLIAELQATKASIEVARGDKVGAIERMRRAFDLFRGIHDHKSAILYGNDLCTWLSDSGQFKEALDVQLICSNIERTIYEKEIERATELSDVRTAIEAERAAIVQREEERNRILHAVMPMSIAERMMSGETRIADSHDSVAIMIVDIVGFTHMASTMKPESLVSLLESLFSEFDSIAAMYGCERLKTIGDAYMAVCMSSDGNGDHVQRMCRMAVDIMNTTFGQAISSEKLRIGLHAGSVVAGVMRGTRLSYDVWGDTVNVAARMEAYSHPGKILCSNAVADAVRDMHEFMIEEREPLAVQGKGLMTTYWLTSSSDQQYHLS